MAMNVLDDSRLLDALTINIPSCFQQDSAQAMSYPTTPVEVVLNYIRIRGNTEPVKGL
jgi:hypothetical protein